MPWLFTWQHVFRSCYGCGQPSVAREWLRPQSGCIALDEAELRRLRRLILAGRLAPCFPGAECEDLLASQKEECPICFLYYKVLNTSECCGQRICTECFLQVQLQRQENCPATCPFCKKAKYFVKLRGPKSKNDQDREKLEQEKVLEARLREREEEFRRDIARQSQRLQSIPRDFRPPLPAPDACIAVNHTSPSSREGNAPSTCTIRNNVSQEGIQNGSTFSVADWMPANTPPTNLNIEELNNLMLEQALYLSMLADRRSDFEYENDVELGSPEQHRHENDHEVSSSREGPSAQSELGVDVLHVSEPSAVEPAEYVSHHQSRSNQVAVGVQSGDQSRSHANATDSSAPWLLNMSHVYYLHDILAKGWSHVAASGRTYAERFALSEIQPNQNEDASSSHADSYRPLNTISATESSILPNPNPLRSLLKGREQAAGSSHMSARGAFVHRDNSSHMSDSIGSKDSCKSMAPRPEKIHMPSSSGVSLAGSRAVQAGAHGSGDKILPGKEQKQVVSICQRAIHSVEVPAVRKVGFSVLVSQLAVHGAVSPQLHRIRLQMAHISQCSYDRGPPQSGETCLCATSYALPGDSAVEGIVNAAADNILDAIVNDTVNAAVQAVTKYNDDERYNMSREHNLQKTSSSSCERHDVKPSCSENELPEVTAFVEPMTDKDTEGETVIVQNSDGTIFTIYRDAPKAAPTDTVMDAIDVELKSKLLQDDQRVVNCIQSGDISAGGDNALNGDLSYTERLRQQDEKYFKALSRFC